MTQEIDYLVVIKWLFFEEEVEVGVCVPVFACTKPHTARYNATLLVIYSLIY